MVLAYVIVDGWPKQENMSHMPAKAEISDAVFAINFMKEMFLQMYVSA